MKSIEFCTKYKEWLERGGKERINSDRIRHFRDVVEERLNINDRG